MSSAADRGVAYLDRRVIPADFDWRAWDSTEEVCKVRPASDFMDEVAASFRGEGNAEGGAMWPWDKANDKGLRFRPGEVTIYAGINGHRKSMLTSQIAACLMRQKQPVLMASFEMRCKDTLERMVRQCSGGNNPSDDYLRMWGKWSGGRLWLYDHLGSCQPRQVAAVGKYAAAELGVKHVFIDSMMKVVGDADDYNGQKRFVGTLCSLAMAQDIHVHLVCHARKGKEERAGIEKWDVKGASEITDQVDNVVLVNKRDDAPDGEPTQWLEVAKQRHGSYEGKMGFYFDADSMSFAEQPGKAWPGLFLHDS